MSFAVKITLKRLPEILGDTECDVNDGSFRQSEGEIGEGAMPAACGGGGKVGVMGLRRASTAASTRSWNSAAETNLSSALPSEIDPSKGLRSGKTVELLDDGILAERYTTVAQLGKGGFGVVNSVKRNADGADFAIKSVSMENVKCRQTFKKELSISKKLNHPNIVKLHEYHQDATHFHLIMDLCLGGNMYDMFGVRCAEHGPKAATALSYFSQMIAGLAYLHHYRIAHRDIKLQNYMLESSEKNSNVKLIDFGLSRSFRSGEMMKTKCGTKQYMAPEVLEGYAYTEKCDIWSMGVVAYCMLTGRHPFNDFDDRWRAQKIKTADVNWCVKALQKHPDHVVKIVKSQLQVKPSDRPSAKRLSKEALPSTQLSKMPSVSLAKVASSISRMVSRQ